MQRSTFEHIFAVITDSDPSDTRMITCICTTGQCTGRANGSRVLGMMGGIVGMPVPASLTLRDDLPAGYVRAGDRRSWGDLPHVSVAGR
jgi:hypothetical protein